MFKAWRWVASVMLVMFGLSIVRAQPSVSVSLPSLAIIEGRSVELLARIDCPAADCVGFTVVVRFDPTFVRVDNAASGAYLGTGINVRLRGISIDNEVGRVSLSALALGDLVIDQPILFRLVVTGIETGVTPLSFERLEITRADNSLIDADAVDSELWVLPPDTPTVRLNAPVPARLDPDPRSPEITTAPSNLALPILGLSDDGAWFFVALPENMQGWVEATGIDMRFEGDLLIVPFGTPTPSNTPTATPTPTSTPTATFTPSDTPTNTPTATFTPSDTPTNTPTATFTPSDTPTNTPTATFTPSDTPTNTPTATFTPSDTPTNTPTATFTPSDTPTNTPTATFTPSDTPTNTPTATFTPSDTPTNTPTATFTPSDTPTNTPTATFTPSDTPTNTPTATFTPSDTPTNTPTATFTPSDTPTNTLTPTPTPTNTPVPVTVTFQARQLSGFAVQFVAQASAQIAAYRWDFGDGTTSEQISPIHLYNAPGRYTVSLEVMSIDGSIASTTGSVLVEPPLVALFVAVPNPAMPQEVQFINRSTGNVVAYLWDFGDGSFSTEVSPTRVYAQPGTYFVTLTVSNPAGITNASSSVVVVSAPTATPTSSPTPAVTATYTPTATFTNTPAPTLTPTPAIVYVRVVAEPSVNVRSGAGTGFNPIQSLPTGTEVEFIRLSDDGQWTRVRLADGREGWIFSSLLERVGAPDAASAISGTVEVLAVRDADLYASASEQAGVVGSLARGQRANVVALSSRGSSWLLIDVDGRGVAWVSASAIQIQGDLSRLGRVDPDTVDTLPPLESEGGS